MLPCLHFPHYQVLVTSPWIIMVTILVNIHTLLPPPCVSSGWTFRPCDGISPSLLKLLLSGIGHNTEKVTNRPPHRSPRQTGSSPPDASQNHPALSTIQAQLTTAIWVQREFTSLHLGLSSRRHGSQVGVCAPYSMLSIKSWVYPVHRYCSMYDLSCWDSRDRSGWWTAWKPQSFGLQDVTQGNSAVMSPSSLSFSGASKRQPQAQRQCPSCVQVTTGKAPSVCSVGGGQRKEQTVGIRPLVQPFTHFARRHCNSPEFVLKFGEWSAEDQLFCQHIYKLWRKW